MKEIIGTNATTPGVATYPTTLLTEGLGGGDGLTIKFGASAPAGQSAYTIKNSGGTTLVEFLKDGPVTYNAILGAAEGVFTTLCGLDATQNPPCLQLPDGAGGFHRTWGGTGIPTTAGKVGAARVGDWYLRRDTPSTANQRLYVCTVAGSPGTWSGIA